MLPLQGFWNAVVYVVTSRGACGVLWRGMLGRGGSGVGNGNGEVVGLGDGKGGERFTGGLGSKKGDTRLERFTSRRTSHRLESDASSITSLRGH